MVEMNQVNIRRVTKNDLDGCFLIEETCFPPSEAAERETIRLRIATFPQGFLVVELNGQLIGMLNSGCTNKEDISDEEFKKLIGHDKDGRNLVIFALAVLPEFQKQGIARRLILRFFEEARNLKKKKIMLICKSDLITYYERLGFKHVGISNSTHGGSTWHDMSLSVGET